MIIRELDLHDHAKGFCETLNNLSACALDKKDFECLWYKMVHFQTGWRHIYVAEIDNRIVGTATLFIERKFIHNGGLAGRIEDVAVHLDYRKQGIGKALIDFLNNMAKKVGCYKVVLDCASWNVEFYEKSGYKQNGVAMRLDL